MGTTRWCKNGSTRPDAQSWWFRWVVLALRGLDPGNPCHAIYTPEDDTAGKLKSPPQLFLRRKSSEPNHHDFRFHVNLRCKSIYLHSFLDWWIFIGKCEQKGFFYSSPFGYTLSFQETPRWGDVSHPKNFPIFAGQPWYWRYIRWYIIHVTYIYIRIFLYLYYTYALQKHLHLSRDTVWELEDEKLLLWQTLVPKKKAAVAFSLNMSVLQSKIYIKKYDIIYSMYTYSSYIHMSIYIYPAYSHSSVHVCTAIYITYTWNLHTQMKAHYYPTKKGYI